MTEHFHGCHPEDEQDQRPSPEAPADTERCWHCRTETTRGACRCADCLDGEYIPQGAIYHCPVCGRWWAYMTGLNITTITFGAEQEGTDGD
ncbi:MAG TPA: hypothetical protein VGS19_29000 [Streptosporangiaceae bacterium]|nr:hypothetical protein [Streptosporangiaceae bacterium]